MCPHRANMKVLIILGCLLSALADVSLEPIGYSSRVSYPDSTYSGASAPDNSYVPSSFQQSSGVSVNSLGSAFDSQLSSRFSLPSKNSPVSFNRHSSARKSEVYSSPSLQYLSPNSFDRALPEPASDYLPPRENQHDIIAPTNTYLSPNVQYDQSSDEFYGGFATSRQYSTESSVNRRNKINRGNTRHDSSRRGRKHDSDSSEYHYNAPENQEPAKYEFEYKVKDDFGNDYSHKENRIGESTQGVYSVLLADGRTQIVHYEADSHGYRPTITYQDTRSMNGYDSQRYPY